MRSGAAIWARAVDGACCLSIMRAVALAEKKACGYS